MRTPAVPLLVLVLGLGLGPLAACEIGADDAALDPLAELTVVAVAPSVDVGSYRVVGSGAGALVGLVDDGASAARADDAATYVRTADGVAMGSHRVGFAGPSGRVERVTINVRADRGTAQGTAQIELYDDATLVARGRVVTLGAWATYADTFDGLSIAAIDRLRARLVLRNPTGAGHLRYTQLWASVGLAAAPPDDDGDGGGALAPILPAATAACPSFAKGTMTFRPAGSVARTVQVYMDGSAATAGGPLVFVWHGQYGEPASMVSYAFGAAGTTAIEQAGGIIVAPTQVTRGHWSYGTAGWTGDDADARLMDEVVACARAAGLVDPRRVHSLGMSLGGFNTAKLGMVRSGYLASVVVMSAGFWGGDAAALEATPSLVARAANKYAVLLMHGGDGDAFEANTILPTVSAYLGAVTRPATVASGGHGVIVCDHGRGHVVPTDASAGVRRFLADHPYGTPLAYGGASLPPELPSYCD